MNPSGFINFTKKHVLYVKQTCNRNSETEILGNTDEHFFYTTVIFFFVKFNLKQYQFEK